MHPHTHVIKILIAFPVLLYSIIAATGLIYINQVGIRSFEFIRFEASTTHQIELLASYLTFAIPLTLAAFFSNKMKGATGEFWNIRSAPKTSRKVSLIIASLVVITILASNPSTLIYRDSYLSSEINLVSSSFVMALILSAAFCPAIEKRITRHTLLALIILIVFAKGTRAIALIPILYLLGGYIFKRKTTGAHLLLLPTLSIILLTLAFANRAGYEHGLIPYIDRTLNLSPDELLSWAIFSGETIAAIFLIGTETLSVSKGEFDASYFFMAVNPLPGNFIGWYQEAPKHLITWNVPYSGISELYNMGHLYLLATSLGISFFYAKLVAEIKTCKTARDLTLLVICIILTYYSLLLMLQYPLRNSIRYLEYSIFIFIAHSATRKWKIKSRF